MLSSSTSSSAPWSPSNAIEGLPGDAHICHDDADDDDDDDDDDVVMGILQLKRC